jgi:hypothetical protein
MHLQLNSPGDHTLIPMLNLDAAVALREAGAGEIVIPGLSDRQAELVKGSEDP